MEVCWYNDNTNFFQYLRFPSIFIENLFLLLIYDTKEHLIPETLEHHGP